MHRRSQLIKTADRGPHGIPQRKKETDGRVRLLSTGQRLRLPAIATSFRNVRLHLYKSASNTPYRVESTYVYVEQAVLVIDAQRATELALTEKIIKCDTCSNRDARTELLPALTAAVDRVDEMLGMC